MRAVRRIQGCLATNFRVRIVAFFVQTVWRERMSEQFKCHAMVEEGGLQPLLLYFFLSK